MKIKFDKIPSLLKNVPLSSESQFQESIKPKEGLVIAVQALDSEAKNNILETTDGRLGKLVTGDIVPAVLGKRRALKEYAGDIPSTLTMGDELYWLCESGLVGEIKGLNERWGIPMKVTVLGALINDGKTINMKDFAIQWKKDVIKSVP
ncbi:MAG: hypothetical protein AAB481_04975, partial [Patescibacteria group bacterium]